MKNLTLILLLISNVAFADCTMRQASQLVKDRKVSDIENLVKEKSHQKCRVKFSVTVDGDTHNVDWTHQDYGDPEISCQKAIQNGMNELYIRLGGEFRTEVHTVCKEGRVPTKVKWAIGSTAMENEFSFDSKKPKYFTHDNTKCRFFTERFEGKVSKGVICRNDDDLWTVVDKW